MNQKTNTAKSITFMSMMLTLLIVLSIIEGTFPPLPYLPPGVKLGLANVVVMYVLIFLGNKKAFLLIIIKSLLIFITRGTTSGIISFFGSSFSILILILSIHLFKSKISYIMLSITGSVFHNIGQIIAVSIILNNNYVFYYFPVLIISGIIMGSITGVLLNIIMPVFNSIFYKQ